MARQVYAKGTAPGTARPRHGSMRENAQREGLSLDGAAVAAGNRRQYEGSGQRPPRSVAVRGSDPARVPAGYDPEIWHVAILFRDTCWEEDIDLTNGVPVIYGNFERALEKFKLRDGHWTELDFFGKHTEHRKLPGSLTWTSVFEKMIRRYIDRYWESSSYAPDEAFIQPSLFRQLVHDVVAPVHHRDREPDWSRAKRTIDIAARRERALQELPAKIEGYRQEPAGESPRSREHRLEQLGVCERRLKQLTDTQDEFAVKLKEAQRVYDDHRDRVEAEEEAERERMRLWDEDRRTLLPGTDDATDENTEAIMISLYDPEKWLPADSKKRHARGYVRRYVSRAWFDEHMTEDLRRELKRAELAEKRQADPDAEARAMRVLAEIERNGLAWKTAKHQQETT
jgi:hypothetical protein